MKKVFSLLILLFAFGSCTQDISSNSAMKATKDGVLWRPTVITATVYPSGSLKIVALLQDQSLTINTVSVSPATYIFGMNNVNKVTYIYNQDATDITYETGTGIGNGNITITKYDTLNKTITGTFKLNAKTTVVSQDVPPVVNFIQGSFYQIPLTPGT